jgi:EAL domain-containing protein (putative c-di-GMP-specific phosphodiesterase class I)
VAERLKPCVREFDTIARHGGDEFVVVIHDKSNGDCVPGLLQRIRDSISSPFRLDKHELYVTCSIGVSLFPRDGRDAQTLLKNADAAMNRAKERGSNNTDFFTAEINEHVVDRFSLATDLHHALERNELLLHYQPQVDSRTGLITGAEALVRWQHPLRGMLAPGTFIAVAEETGLILPIGEWVARTACAQAQAWLKAGLSLPIMSVNISVRQFMRKDLIDTLVKILGDTQLDPHTLELEVTEGLIMNNADEFVITLKKLKEAGIRLAIDDFGTGYSSLSYLKRMPLDRLKIDQSFVHDINKDPESTTIVEAIINLGHSLKLKVIAEGVETAEQLEFLRDRGCEEYQGYYFSRPIPAEQFTALLMSGQAGIPQSGAPIA